MLEIRKARENDKPQIWEIIKAVIARGDTYTFAPDSPEEEMLAFWFAPDKHTYVALLSEPPALAGGLSEPGAVAAGLSEPPVLAGGQMAGTFFLKANQPGLGAHVGNAGYMVAPGNHGKGIGRQMAEWSLDEARRLGFTAMQFNFVVKSNSYAVKLWQDIGFDIIGEIPEAFNHKELGMVNAYIMYRKL